MGAFVQERVPQHQIEQRVRRRDTLAEIFRLERLRVVRVLEQPINVIAAGRHFVRLDCLRFG